VLVGIGTLFVIAWGIGILTVPHTGWFLHLPLLVGGAAILFGLLGGRAASMR